MKFHWLIYGCAALLAAGVLPSSAPAAQHAGRSPSVTFLLPTMLESKPFWRDYAEFMTAAARSLGMRLDILEAKNRFAVGRNAQRVLQREDKPDYLVYLYLAQSTFDVLDEAEKAGVKSVMVNTDVLPTDRALVGKPRERYAQWIGHIFPDDESTGRQLADILIHKGEQRGKWGARTLQLIGIGGDHSATSSLYRKQGLRCSIAEHASTTLKRFVVADWKRDVSRYKAGRLMEDYPDARLWWAADDQTALGIVDAAREHGLVPGKDILTGGIDWSPQGLEAVRTGDFTATIGGHFMEGAWALIMILDYENGHDFAQPSPTLHSRMRVIDASTIDTYAPALDRRNWSRIDFRRFSRTYNPQLKAYDFSPDAVVRALR